MQKFLSQQNTLSNYNKYSRRASISMLEQQWCVLLAESMVKDTFFHPFSYTTLCPFLESFLPFVHRSNSAHFFSSWRRGHLFLEDFFESTEQSSELFFGFTSCVLCMHVHSELKPSMQLTSTLTWLYYPTVFDLTLVFHEALSLDDMIWLFTLPRSSINSLIGSICGQFTPDSLNLRLRSLALLCPQLLLVWKYYIMIPAQS